MGIQVTCGACGRQVNVKEKYAGRLGGCPHCKAPLRVPVAQTRTDEFSLSDSPADSDDDESDVVILDDPEPPVRKSPSASSSSVRPRRPDPPPSNESETGGSITFYCPKCERRMKVPARSAGKKTRCNGCGQAILIPDSQTDIDDSPSNSWHELLDEELAIVPLEPVQSTLAPLPPRPRVKSGSRSSGSDFNWQVLAAALLIAISIICGYALAGVRGAAVGPVYACWLIMVVTMFRSGSPGLASLSIFPCGPLLAYCVGWSKVNEWNLGRFMVFWTVTWIVATLASIPAAMEQYDKALQRQQQRPPVSQPHRPPNFYK